MDIADISLIRPISHPIASGKCNFTHGVLMENNHFRPQLTELESRETPSAVSSAVMLSAPAIVNHAPALVSTMTATTTNSGGAAATTSTIALLPPGPYSAGTGGTAPTLTNPGTSGSTGGSVTIDTNTGTAGTTASGTGSISGIGTGNDGTQVGAATTGVGATIGDIATMTPTTTRF
jgi:hypothetical protein